jgi:hypothetical protein
MTTRKKEYVDIGDNIDSKENIDSEDNIDTKDQQPPAHSIIK